MKATAKILGTVHKCETTSFLDERSGESITWARLQVIVPDDNVPVFDQIFNVKIKREEFGLIPDTKKLMGRYCEVDIYQQINGKETSHYLASVPKPVQQPEEKKTA